MEAKYLNVDENFMREGGAEVFVWFMASESLRRERKERSMSYFSLSLFNTAKETTSIR